LFQYRSALKPIKIPATRHETPLLCDEIKTFEKAQTKRGKQTKRTDEIMAINRINEQ